jgi:hypothetical protein
VPAFSPDILDYYVRCEGSTAEPAANALTVSFVASEGATASLQIYVPALGFEPGGSADAREMTLTLSVQEDQAVVATSSNGADSRAYWVRCLPSDFPQMQWLAHDDGGARTPGYYLLGNLHPEAAAQGYAMVLDENGVPLWYFRQPTGLGVCDVDEVVPGAVSFVPTTAGYGETAIDPFEVHPIGPRATKYAAPSGVSLDEHELRVLPNGHYLVFSDLLTTGVNLGGLGLPLADGGIEPLGAGSTIADCKIVEFDPATGQVTWKWLMSEHFDAALVATYVQTASGVVGPDGGAVIDPFHCNSIDVDPNNGDLLVSARNTDSIFYVERPSGRVRWKLGGKAASKDGAVFVAVADPFLRQHDARLLPGWSPTCQGGAGQISVFDDRTGTTTPARGALYEVVVGGGDGGSSPEGGCTAGGSPEAGTAGRAELVWQYAGSSPVTGTGSFRISPDGSRVIGWGNETSDGFVLTEVDVGKNDLLDFGFPDGNASFRVIKVPVSALDRNAMRAAAGAP